MCMNNTTNICQKETTQELLKMLENKIEKDNVCSTTKISNQNENVKESITKRKKRGKYKKWKIEEVEWLINNYPINGRKYCMEYLKCSVVVLKKKVKQLKIKFTGILPKDKNNKICNKCKEEKLIDEFYTRGNNKVRSRCKKCLNNLYKEDIIVRISNICRKRVSQTLEKNFKSEKTFSLIGCSPKFLKEYLESKFKLGMNWDNYGDSWQIDHIIPCCQFNLENLNEQKICFHYTNLRPLWATTKIARKFGDFKSIGNLNRNKFNN